MVGTAGHIDHGKSSLVRAMTGIDPDRLKEEKERGLTIDLGFARFPLSDGRLMGIIDVPGHERFIRNMVAGSTALDIALVVIAADDGVMPQTIEHLDILELLGVERGLVVLTKVDLVDEEIAEVAVEEIRDLLKGTKLEGADIVRVSSPAGIGIDEVKEKLEALSVEVSRTSHEGHFRMPVQRVFQLKGIGTVVTGIPLSGSVCPGDSLEFLPGSRSCKVRAVHAYGGELDRAVAGHSTALSIPDARNAPVGRGHVVAAPGIFKEGDAVDVELELLPRVRSIEHRRPVRFHTGTSECHGTLLLLDRNRMEPDGKVVARVQLDDVVSCAPGDSFLLRLQNPVVTVGGGRILRLQKTPGRYRRMSLADDLHRLQSAGDAPERRIVEELGLVGAAGWTSGELAVTLAMDRGEIEELLRELPEVHFYERGGRAYLREIVESGRAELFQSVERMLRNKPLAASIKRAALRPSRDLPLDLQKVVLDELQKEGRVRTRSGGRVLFLDRLTPLSAGDQKLLDRLVGTCEEVGFRPLTADELREKLAMSEADYTSLFARAEDEGMVDSVGDHIYGSTVIRKALVAIRNDCLRHDGELNIPELRDERGTSRKYLIPLLEYVDGLGLTQLRSGVRRLISTSELNEELSGSE